MRAAVHGRSWLAYFVCLFVLFVVGGGGTHTHLCLAPSPLSSIFVHNQNNVSKFVFPVSKYGRMSKFIAPPTLLHSNFRSWRFESSEWHVSVARHGTCQSRGIGLQSTAGTLMHIQTHSSSFILLLFFYNCHNNTSCGTFQQHHHKHFQGTNLALAKQLRFRAWSGPTYGNVPPFDWTNSDLVSRWLYYVKPEQSGACSPSIPFECRC